MNDLTASSVPASFRSEAYLQGWIPFRALQTDPRFSYCLYIPPAHYNPTPTPASAPLPLVITIHSTNRRAEQSCLSLSAFADTNRCAILAPLFPTSIGARYEFDNYKTLRYGDLRFDLVLLAMVEELRAIWGPGISTERFFLVGFSGGGQFVHRFLYFHPDRLLSVSIGAPGRPTDFLDGFRAWPRGVKDVESLFAGNSIDLEMVKKVKAVQLVIGSRDTEVPGKGFYQWLEAKKASLADEEGLENSAKLPAPSLGRMEAMANVKLEMEKVGVCHQLDIVDGVAHDSQAILPSVCSFLKPQIQEWHANQKT